jgi:ATP/ADP translocase
MWKSIFFSFLFWHILIDYLFKWEQPEKLKHEAMIALKKMLNASSNYINRARNDNKKLLEEFTHLHSSFSFFFIAESFKTVSQSNFKLKGKEKSEAKKVHCFN